MKKEIKKLYYDNGQLHYEIPTVNGKACGIVNSWNSNGQKWIQDSWKNHLQQGVLIVFRY